MVGACLTEANLPDPALAVRGAPGQVRAIKSPTHWMTMPGPVAG